MAYPNPSPETFGKRLKRLSGDRGLSNKDLARITGAHDVTVSRWMGGQEPKAVAFLRLARALDVEPEYLLADLWTEPPHYFPVAERPTKSNSGTSRRKRKGA